MSITIVNKRIVPYQQKDALKAIYGDTLDFAFAVTGHQGGDEYTLVADYETIVYPPLRPVCAMTSDYTYTAGAQDGGTLEMSLAWATARMRDWVSLIAKPMPITIQLVRVRGGGRTQETLLLDYILALPSVADNEPMVYPGDPLADLLASKLDKPDGEGSVGQVPAIGEGGVMVWTDNGGGSGGVTPGYVSSAISSAVAPVSYTLAGHIADSTIHVTAQDRVLWGGKQDKIDADHKLPYIYISGAPTSVSQLVNDANYQTSANVSAAIAAATSNMATSAYVSTTVSGAVSNAVTPVSEGLSSHVADSTIHVTAGEKVTWGGKATTNYVDTAVSNGLATRLPLVDTLGTSLTAVAGETISATLPANASMGFAALSAGQMGIAYALINPSTYTLTFGGTMVKALTASKLNFCEILIVGSDARMYALDAW